MVGVVLIGVVGVDGWYGSAHVDRLGRVVGVDGWHRSAHVDWLGRVVRNHTRNHMDCRGGVCRGWGGGLYCGWGGGLYCG